MSSSRQPRPCHECGRTIYFDGICYRCSTRHERERYQALSPAEIAHMAQKIIDSIDTVGEGEYEDFKALLAYHDIDTARIAEAALQEEIFYPAMLYRNATPAVRDALIQRLLAPDCEDANHLLQCLAMQGDDTVRKTFFHLEHHPLPWRERLYVNPSIYAECGGWTFDTASGARIALTYPACRAVLPASKDAVTPLGSANHAVRIGQPRGESCPHCRGTLVDILDLDGRDERLTFLGIPHPLRIPVCPHCASLCEKTLVRYTPDGASTMQLIEPFGDPKPMPAVNYTELAATDFALSATPVPPFYACGGDEVVTLGGMADWIQDWVYQDCPDCGKKMRLLAALPWAALMNYCEGTLYTEICTDCRVIALFHQQT